RRGQIQVDGKTYIAYALARPRLVEATPRVYVSATATTHAPPGPSVVLRLSAFPCNLASNFRLYSHKRKNRPFKTGIKSKVTLTNSIRKKNNQSMKEVKGMNNNSTKTAKANKPTVKERGVRDLKAKKDPMGGAKPQRGFIVNT